MKQGMAFTVGSGIGEVPENAKRFFSAEVMDRWPGLSLQDILYLRADRDELILFLRMRYGFAPRRAASEADNFIADLQKRLRAALGSSAPMKAVQSIPA
jgi:hypothetical protein